MTAISSREVTEKYNISYQTLNFYTNLGLFEIRRRVGNKRFYDDEEIRTRMSRISELKEEGYPLRMIIKHLNKDFTPPTQNGGLA